jgi:hypothetical protein
MKSNLKVMVAISCLALAALACQAVTGGSETDVPPTDVIIESTSEPLETEEILSTDEPSSTTTEESTGESDVLLDDDFREGRDNWATGTNADSSVEYLNDSLNVQLFTDNYIVWTFPNEDQYENIHMEVTVNNNGSDADSAFGFFCNMQWPIDDSRYYFAVTVRGEYAIARAALAQDDEVLTNNGSWDTSDLIPENAASYRLGADCGNGTLTLYVDGQEIDSVSDSTYTSGSFALFAWSGEEVNTVNFSFDDFVMTELP